MQSPDVAWSQETKTIQFMLCQAMGHVVSLRVTWLYHTEKLSHIYIYMGANYLDGV